MQQVTLHLGDCVEQLAGLEVDSIITDPIWPNAPAGMFQEVDQYDLLKRVLEVITAKRVVIVMRMDSDPRFLTAVPKRYKFFRNQLLPYRVPGYIGRKLGGQEYAYSFGEPIKSAEGRRVVPGVGPAAPTTEKRGHPCARSLVHMMWLVNWHSDPGETVCDPFMGSGTTIVAAYHLGRDAVGCEIVPEYFRIAQDWIAEARQQLQFDMEVIEK